MKPGDHFVDAQNGNNDLSEEYIKEMKKIFIEHDRGDEIYKIVEDPKSCRPL